MTPPFTPRRVPTEFWGREVELWGAACKKMARQKNNPLPHRLEGALREFWGEHENSSRAGAENGLPPGWGGTGGVRGGNQTLASANCELSSSGMNRGCGQE